jgi:hypothetical protein
MNPVFSAKRREIFRSIAANRRERQAYGYLRVKEY